MEPAQFIPHAPSADIILRHRLIHSMQLPSLGTFSFFEVGDHDRSSRLDIFPFDRPLRGRRIGIPRHLRYTRRSRRGGEFLAEFLPHLGFGLGASSLFPSRKKNLEGFPKIIYFLSCIMYYLNVPYLGARNHTGAGNCLYTSFCQTFP